MTIRPALRRAGVAAVAAAAIGIVAARGRLEPAYLASLSAASCLVIGAFAGLAAALAGVGWRPSALERACLIVVFAGLGLGVFGNRATAHLTGLPAALAEPSRSAYCWPDDGDDASAASAVPVAPTPPVAPPGCALVKRAFQLGYAKSLGDCAPREIAAEVVAAGPRPAQPPCEQRQLDEPFLHFAWRRIADAAGSVADANPIDAVAHRIDAVGTRLGYLDTLIAEHVHAITGSPHAAHHLWVNLPDPRPGSWRDTLDPPTCDDRYVDLPLWPAWSDGAATPSALVEHVIGQLLFATRFGKAPTSCRDYTIHWDAPADACARLLANPAGFLAGDDALAPTRDVLDRRRRQQELRALAAALDEPPTVAEPPPAETVVSLQCFIVDPAGAGAATGSALELDGARLPVREQRVAAVRTDGGGPIELYAQLGTLLAGGGYSGPTGGADRDARSDAALAAVTSPPTAAALDGPGFLLTRLEPLHDADPFLGARWPLDRADLADVYPFHRHLRAYVDDFRRRFQAQRGRL